MQRVWPVRLLLTCSLWLWPLSVHAHEWYSWRGPEQNGVSRDKDLPAKFSTDPSDPDSNLIWKAPYGARATPIVMHGRLYLNNQVGEGVNEQERVMCLDADTGKVLWQHKFNVFHTDIVSVRLGWTNMAGDPATGNVYWHGTQGDFVCFDKDGKILWQRQLTEQDGRISGYGGRVTSPVLDGDLIIIGMVNASWGDQAMGSTRFLAMDKKTGAPVWWSSPADKTRDTYYSTPVVAVINGQRLLISGGGDGGIHAVNVYTGAKVWSHQLCKGAVNCSPVVAGTKVYIGHGYENLDNNILGQVICLDAGEVSMEGEPKVVWRKDGIKVRYTTPILHEGRLYVAEDTARLHCLDAASGKPLWKFYYGRNAMGSPVWADGKIYVANVNSKFHILKPGPTRCEELYEHFFPSKDGVTDVEFNGNPAVANGRLYFASSEELYCLGKKDHPTKSDPIPPPPKEAELGAAAQVHVLPADVTLHPGDSADFRVRLLDKYGRAVKEGDYHGTWSLPFPAPPKPNLKPPALQGEILPASGTAEGKALSNSCKLTVSKVIPSQQGMVLFSSKLGEAKARVRVAARLPYAPKFDKLPDGAVPGGWVNAAGKFAVGTLKDGSKVLRKNNINPSPLVARGNAFLGEPEMSDYTMEADVQGTKVGTDMPDVGVVACRYTLALWGNLGSEGRLRLTSWDAVPRVDQAVDFKFAPGVWYRMKLTTQAQGDQAVVRGKVWQRDQPEPKDWTLEFTDPTPNRQGSPAIYGLVNGILEGQPGTEVYYDNIRVTPNK